ncbi:nuclear transport factor 2 family protein [Angustibacter sp. Root456]|uniref:YybH family protein n=1 Tax=Angustibacter sp. Root456 TaxID=1736539 RepID=UPI0006F1DDDC|nr:nuclear transport factor 2 family protein [Angustibacter sp. Root456]KQX69783.1 ketosteroid isomerase [Angustibacter sp. Root456]
MTVDDDVLATAAALVQAFGRHDTDAYFASFAPEATFLFYTHDAALRSRDAYRQLWSGWETDGFRVLSCSSSDQHVQQLTENVAVFTHRVHTRVRTGQDEESLDERETIVFRREDDGRWLAVHEHLSPTPTA